MPFDRPIRALTCEAVGTFVLVTGSAATIIGAHALPNSGDFVEHLIVALVGSLIVSSSILLFGKLSGAFINPTVTISQTLVGDLPRRMLLLYLLVQLSAAVVSGLFLRFVFGSLGLSTEFGLPRLEDGATPATGIALETIGAFIRSTSSIYSTQHLKNRPKTHALLVGVALFIPTVIIGPFTGAAFNPAVSLGPAVASMDFSDQWIYLTSAILGSFLAAGSFRFVSERHKS